jgi:hypothetical protein
LNSFHSNNTKLLDFVLIRSISNFTFFAYFYHISPNLNPFFIDVRNLHLCNDGLFWTIIYQKKVLCKNVGLISASWCVLSNSMLAVIFVSLPRIYKLLCTRSAEKVNFSLSFGSMSIFSIDSRNYLTCLSSNYLKRFSNSFISLSCSFFSVFNFEELNIRWIMPPVRLFSFRDCLNWLS